LFFRSTDPVAKERLFLERFTCFQQGQPRKYATLATQPPFAVETAEKKQASLRLIFSVYTWLSSSYSVQALPSRLTQLSAFKSDN
jgi:hypothetical protein